MSYGCYLGLRLMLQRFWRNLNKSPTNRSNEVLEQEDEPTYHTIHYKKEVVVPKKVRKVPKKSKIKNQRLTPLPSQTPMNILSLPDEMIASVLKHSKFETVTRHRKTNVRIDNITVGYGISKAKIFHLNAYPSLLRFKYKKIDMFEYQAKAMKNCSGRIRCSDIYNALKESLKNSRGVRTVKINDIRIDTNWLNLIDGIKEKHEVNITLNGCYFLVTLDEIKKVIEKFKSVEINIDSANAEFDGNLLSDEAVCSLMSFATVDLLFMEKLIWNLPNITDETLKELQRIAPEEFYIGVHRTNFTIPEVIKTIKRRYEVNTGPYSYDYSHWWTLGRVKVNTREEMLAAVDSIRAISEHVLVEEEPTYIYIKASGCTVRIALD